MTGRINDFFLPKDRYDSLYHFSYWNPLNLVPLYALTRCFGISARFWDEIFVPIHCASLITTSMKDMPAVVAPLLESVVALERPSRMDSWADSPRHVFGRMTEGFRDGVHTSSEITAVRRKGPGFEIEDAAGRGFTADRIVFACQAPSILAALEQPSWLECTFVVSARNPGLKDLGRPMLVTFNSKKAIGKIEAEIELPNPAHTLSLGNLANMLLMRWLQGRGGIHYCGSFTTPEGGHDLSFLSGLVAARSIGAAYPFAMDASPAVADYRRMQRIMLGRVLPDAPRGA